MYVLGRLVVALTLTYISCYILSEVVEAIIIIMNNNNNNSNNNNNKTFASFTPPVHARLQPIAAFGTFSNIPGTNCCIRTSSHKLALRTMPRLVYCYYGEIPASLGP